MSLNRSQCWGEFFFGGYSLYGAGLAGQSLPPPVVFVPRWLTGAWSECSTSCGEGFHSRQVTCKRTRASGVAQVMPPTACAPQNRPLGRRPCSSRPCVPWVVEPGGQVKLTDLVFDTAGISHLVSNTFCFLILGVGNLIGL